MRRHLKFIIVAIMGVCTACNDWLDVQPSTETRLEDQLESTRGFIEVLNGVYIAMAQPELYGQHLMFGDIEFLAQNHYPGGVLLNQGFATYDFTDNQSINRFESYWLGLYNAITNVNSILDNIDERSSLFTEDDYNVIKGEALALRAFLHFDALRLFGEAYSESTKANVQIPYYESAELIRYAHLSGELVYQQILNDLDEAEVLLAQSDPLVSSYQGNLFSASERIYHLNYFALLGVKARVFITRGDEALEDYDSASYYSQRVINEANWSWVTSDRVSGTTVDVLFSSELLWVVNMSNLVATYNSTFGQGGYQLSGDEYNGADRLFDIGGLGASDWRQLFLLQGDVNIGGNSTFSNASSVKYDQEEVFSDDGDPFDAVYEYTSVPMLRTSELMLINAEAMLRKSTATVADIETAAAILFELKQKREATLPDDNGWFAQRYLEETINEYRKELFLEGQTFYIYKRMYGAGVISEIPDAISLLGTIQMQSGNFVLPIPNDEILLGNR